MREKDIERILREEVKRLGGRSYKWVSPGNAGVPDRIVIFPDRPPIFVELKSNKGKLTALQEAQQACLVKLGQDVRVIRGLSGLAEFFEAQGYPDTARDIAGRHGGKENAR